MAHRDQSAMVLAARYLAQSVGEGGVFTIDEVERWITDEIGVKRVEVDRRIRALREYRWIIWNYRDDRTLKREEHRLVKVGDDVGHPGVRKQAQGCPSNVRRAVFERDGRECTVCGIKDGEEYPDRPGVYARMTIGRKLPGARGGAYIVANCRVECAWCNEAVRDSYYPATLVTGLEW